jgi:hypothetical protein
MTDPTRGGKAAATEAHHVGVLLALVVLLLAPAAVRLAAHALRHRGAELAEGGVVGGVVLRREAELDLGVGEIDVVVRGDEAFGGRHRGSSGRAVGGRSVGRRTARDRPTGIAGQHISCPRRRPPGACRRAPRRRARRSPRRAKDDALRPN